MAGTATVLLCGRCTFIERGQMSHARPGIEQYVKCKVLLLSCIVLYGYNRIALYVQFTPLNKSHNQNVDIQLV